MRRKDREITDRSEILSIIKKCDVCRLAMNDGKFPYIVPLNFGIQIENDQLYLYFHGATEGKKIDLLKSDTNVSFEMDCDHNFIFYDERMSCTMGYRSVVGKGIAEILDDSQKYDGLKIIMKHYHEEDFVFNKDMIKVTNVFRVKVVEMTGKCRDNIHLNAGKQHTLKVKMG